MDAESNLAEVAVSSNNGSTSGEPKDPTVLKEKLAEELKSAASLKGGGDGPALDVPLEKDDLLERLDKIDTDSNEAVSKPSEPSSGTTNDVDMENDDLIQRLEAMEKGEEEPAATKDVADENAQKDEAAGEVVETNHQNGLEKDNEAELLQEEVSKDKLEEKMEVDGDSEKKEDVSPTEPTSNGASIEEQVEQPTSSAKRRHSQDEESQHTEPSSKKLHVEEAEVVDAPKEDVPSEQKPEEEVEPEVDEPLKVEENDNEAAATQKQEESTKTDEVAASEPCVSENKVEEKEEEKPSDASALSSDLDPTKDEEKKVEEALTEEKEAEEPEVPMEPSEPSELPVKVDEITPASEQKEEVDATPIVVSPAESSEATTEPEVATVEAESETAPEPVEEKKEAVEKESKVEEEKVQDAVEEKTSEERNEPVAEVQESAAPETTEVEKEPEETKPTVNEPMDATPVEEEMKEADPVEQEPDEVKSVEQKSEETKTEETNPEETKSEEEKPEETKIEEEKPEETKIEEEKPVDTKTEEEKPVDTKTEEEPAPSEPVEDVPKPVEEEKTQPESLPDLPAEEIESKSETLPDTEPNTESSQDEQPTSSSPCVVDEKTDDVISSSSEKKDEGTLPSSTEVDSAVTATDAALEVPVEKSCEAETVTSSDEKPPTEVDVPQKVDSTPEVAVVAASEPANDDEPMEVDSEPAAETSSTKEVSEPPCIEKKAYVCTDEEAEKASEAEPQESTAEAVSESVSVTAVEQEPVQKPTEPEEEKMEVDSAAPTQSKPDPDVTESMNASSEELIESLAKDNTATAADSQSETAATVSEHNKNMDSTEGPADDSKSEGSKTLDDSIECSLPTSSSDKMADRLKQRLDLMTNGSSTPNAAVSSSNVYNSTPIQKQFEISSENVSKISRTSVDHSHHAEEEHSAITVGDQSSISDEKEAAVASTSGISKPPAEVKKQPVTDTSDDTSITIKDGSSMKTTESSEVDSCTASSALNTADEINMYANNARKFNGISSTSGSELDDKSTATPTNVSTTGTPSTVVNKLDLTPAFTSEETVYEVSVWFDGSELQFLSVEKLDHKSPTASATAGSTQDLTGIDSSKQSSNGSVGSLGPFSLPPARPAADSAMSHSTTTETSSGTSHLKSSLPKMKHTVRGARALATLMIEEFTKIKKALNKDDEVSDAEPETPMKTPKGRAAPAAKKTPTPTPSRGQKRSRTDSETTEEEPSKPKQAAKQAKKATKAESTSPSVAATPETTETAESSAKKEDEQCCLARWSDRKYYAGKVTGYKGDNKFMILFEDGASKALAKDVIVFGEKDTLPIMGHSVHALTGGDTYEPGIVQEIKRNESNEVVYTVEIATGNVEVTASDMYLNEEQAKAINKACKAAEAADEKNTSMQSPQSSGRRGAHTPVMQTPEEASGTPSAEKGSRSTRRRGADKPQTPVTPEAGYSGGVGKKGRRGRRLS